ncbi:helix-turn-helix domain-containing protein [Clostridium sp. CF011]|uniref:helix-turn-helix domain-containing protein n=1 Tax=unclassified Clostridium TaxID=2614128 RepID=UPI001C0D0ABD|nr:MULTISPECIES: helix-turn-helix domain-containing protein [unclassified Clostridium]MBU3093133.1 helix-turn-helix domain-containing protein [Clostridium sp. CF011]MBW9147103.1 helix-turn-helix domain-containing protein [Clostridium sp. CM027]UVE39550.1 helix-turn-helix domain-containing protein [Clostridium sp. CM027]WAG68454.1 helix-turn-helix domain-containing protein [Clostridium sp. CF011]
MVVNVEKRFELVSYMADIEKGIIEKTLNKNENNVSKTSRELSISRQDLQYKIKKYKITLR